MIGPESALQVLLIFPGQLVLRDSAGERQEPPDVATAEAEQEVNGFICGDFAAGEAAALRRPRAVPRHRNR